MGLQPSSRIIFANLRAAAAVRLRCGTSRTSKSDCVPLLKADKATLVFEAVGDDKVRVNCAGWEDAKVILPDEALQVVAFGKILVVTRTDRPAEYLNVELHGLADAGQATLPVYVVYTALRFRASTVCGRMSAPVTRLTSVMESYGKLIAACALRMDSSSGPDMKQNAFPSLRLTCAA
jgi:hypothetical protein